MGGPRCNMETHSDAPPGHAQFLRQSGSESCRIANARTSELIVTRLEPLDQAKTLFREFKKTNEVQLAKNETLLTELVHECGAEQDPQQKALWEEKVTAQKALLQQLEDDREHRTTYLEDLEAKWKIRRVEQRDATAELLRVRNKLADLGKRQTEWGKSHGVDGEEQVPSEILAQLKKEEQKYLVLSGENLRVQEAEYAAEQLAKLAKEEKLARELEELSDALQKKDKEKRLTMVVLEEHKTKTERVIDVLKLERLQLKKLLTEREFSHETVEKLNLPDEFIEEMAVASKQNINEIQEKKSTIDKYIAAEHHTLVLVEVLIRQKKADLEDVKEELRQLDLDLGLAKELEAKSSDPKSRASYRTAIVALELRKNEIMHVSDMDRGGCGLCLVM